MSKSRARFFAEIARSASSLDSLITDTSALTSLASSQADLEALIATSSLVLPSGTTAERPTSPSAGAIRYNTTEGVYEGYNGSLWVNLSDSPYLDIDYVVVAGGGGGGAASGYQGGSGGAGGYRTSVTGDVSGGGASAEATLTRIVDTPYTITIGAGGAARFYPAYSRGGSGTSSIFDTITTVGGGGGGGGNGGGGGSGGGGAYYRGAYYAAGSGTANEGYNGSSTQGGGAGGTNGAGVTSSITGSSVTFARGGDTNPNGGLRAEKGSGGNAQSGSANPPSGGQGGAVYLKIPSTHAAIFSAGVTASVVATPSGFNVYEVTAAGANDTVTFRRN